MKQNYAELHEDHDQASNGQYPRGIPIGQPLPPPMPPQYINMQNYNIPQNGIPQMPPAY
jgi:hypothetical protein